MIYITDRISLGDYEVQLTAIRSQGAGGQNVNKVSSAIHLRFDIKHSSLPEYEKEKLLTRSDSRISKDGVLVLKAQEFRTQEQNRDAALQRLRELIIHAGTRQRKRIATKPTKGSKLRHAKAKKSRSNTKKLRQKPGRESH